MKDIYNLIQNFEVEVNSSLDEVIGEVPALREYRNHQPIKEALENVSTLLYRKLEELAEDDLERASDDLSDIIGDSSEFSLTNVSGDTIYAQHKDTGVRLTITLEEE